MDLVNKKIAVIVAHPDDEVIGCGGLIHKASRLGSMCKVVLASKRADKRGIENWDALLNQFQQSCTTLNAEAIIEEGLVEDLTAEQNVLEMVFQIQRYIDWSDIVLCHWKGDMHQAHKAVSRAVELSTRPFRNPKTVLCFEIASSTNQGFDYNFSPNCFVKLSKEDFEKKRDSMRLYKSEIVSGRTPDDLGRHMQIRGSQIGAQYAEAFVIVRHFF